MILLIFFMVFPNREAIWFFLMIFFMKTKSEILIFFNDHKKTCRVIKNKEKLYLRSVKPKNFRLRRALAWNKYVSYRFITYKKFGEPKILIFFMIIFMVFQNREAILIFFMIFFMIFLRRKCFDFFYEFSKSLKKTLHTSSMPIRPWSGTINTTRRFFHA